MISATKSGGVFSHGVGAFDVSEELKMYLMRAFSDFSNVFPEVVCSIHFSPVEGGLLVVLLVPVVVVLWHSVFLVCLRCYQWILKKTFQFFQIVGILRQSESKLQNTNFTNELDP